MITDTRNQLQQFLAAAENQADTARREAKLASDRADAAVAAAEAAVASIRAIFDLISDQD